MFITGIGTANPPQRYTQAECWLAYQESKQFKQLDKRARAMLRKVLLAENGIRTRYFALNPLTEVFDATPDNLYKRFAQHAPALATQAAERALRQAGHQADEIDAVIISTCTGYLCPGLSSYVAERLGLRPDALGLDLVGQGCGAALPNMRAAEALLAAKRCQRILSVCVEVCSAAFYIDNDPGVLISNCLFADGAAAVVLADTPNQRSRQIEWKETASRIDPLERDTLRFEQKNGMLRNILTRPVPQLAARNAELVLDEVLDKAGILRSQISTWIWHAGGRDVLTALQQQLSLAAADLNWSSAVLSEFGNLSSPFVYFVLQKALKGNAPGGWWWLSSFGAGFSCHGALLEVL
ncbi:MAG TPA: stilbene synthase [Burkholderiales bacterium]|nr:stilbene synthase [Burkholderiales bacterium]